MGCTGAFKKICDDNSKFPSASVWKRADWFEIDLVLREKLGRLELELSELLNLMVVGLENGERIVSLPIEYYKKELGNRTTEAIR